MPASVRTIPQGYHSVTPYLTVNSAARAIDFYVKALGAKEIMRMEGPPGKISHAEIKIGDSMIMLSDEMPQAATRSPQTLGGATGGVFLYVDNVDSVFDHAVSAGAKPVMRPQDMFWGDRFGSFTDPFGQVWSVATHKEDVAPEEMKRRMKEFTSQRQAQPV